MFLKSYYLTYSKSTAIKPDLYGKDKLCTFKICLGLQSTIDTRAKIVARLEQCRQDAKTRLTSYARTRKRVSRRGRVKRLFAVRQIKKTAEPVVLMVQS